MIRIDRHRISKPALLDSDKVSKLQQEAAAFYKRSSRSRAQQRFRFEPIHRHPEIKEPLLSLFQQKCAYCESPLGVSSSADVDFFRPIAGTVDLQGHFFPDHYWWLAYEWENMYLSCPICNRSKGNRFPILGERAHPRTKGEKLQSEQPLLIDPCIDFPEEHLVFSEDGEVAGATERGNITIEVLGLNRSRLLTARRSEFEKLKKQWMDLMSRRQRLKWSPTELSHHLDKLSDAKEPYAGMRRQMLGQWMTAEGRLVKGDPDAKRWQDFTEELTAKQAVVTKNARRAKLAEFQAYQQAQESYTLESETEEEKYFLRTRMIERVELHNFRIIRDMELDLVTTEDDRAPWLMLLGENGTGKSSVLHAVALALMGSKYRDSLGLDASKLVRHRSKTGHVRVFLSGGSEPIELHFRRDSPRFEAKPDEPKALLLGYGATRLLPRGDIPPQTGTRYARIDNLFNPFVPLNNANDWLMSLPDESFQHIARALKDLLSLDDKGKLVRIKKGNIRQLEIRAFGDRFTLDELSDGFQSVLALATDIMAVMLERWQAMEVAEGVVLIDEIGAHLHPRWKMRIVKSLRQVFPRIQFIASTHSPLCLRGLAANEVAVMRRDENDRVVAVTDLPPVEGLRIDQLLTSEHFGLSSTVDPDIEEQFQEYYALLAKKPRTKSEKQRLAELKEQLKTLDQMGSTRRENLMLEMVDSFLAQQPELLAPEKQRQLKAATRRKVAQIWNRVEKNSG